MIIETKKHLRQIIVDKDEMIEILFNAANYLSGELEKQTRISKNWRAIAEGNVQENRSIKELLQPIFDKMGYKL